MPYRYEIPESDDLIQSQSRLSPEAERALASLATGPSLADSLLAPETYSTDKLSTETAVWASQELESPGGSMESWQQYCQAFTNPPPRSLKELAKTHPDLDDTLAKLYRAKKDLEASGDTTSDGRNVGRTMHLVLIPWQAFKDHLSSPDILTTVLRHTQVKKASDWLDSIITESLKAGQPLYRNPKKPGKLLSASEYLSQRIAEDGPWGVMLMQTSNMGGAARFVNLSPDALTNGGQTSFQIAGHAVDAMGVFEWLALTFQKMPPELAPQHYSWLLANRINLDMGGTVVPSGHWDADQNQLRTSTSYSDTADYRILPRLAVR